MSKLKKALEKAKAAREKSQESFAPELEQAYEEPGTVNRPIKPIEKVIGPQWTTGEPPSQTRERTTEPPRRSHEEKETVRKVISPSYQKTRMVTLDKKVLKRNKIISLFHEEKMTDQIKILSTQILNKMDAMGGNTLLITSTKASEGKTFTAINLALCICLKVDRTVLLVDADLRKPDIHRYLGIDAAEGLSDYLLYQAEIPNLLLNPGIEKLTILPGGKALPNSTELLGSPRMELLVKEMKERYPERFIIFDASALLARADPLIFSRYIDGILLVVEAEKTSSREVGKALALLKGKTVVGIVLNKTK